MFKRKQSKLSAFLSPDGQKTEKPTINQQSWTTPVEKDDFAAKKRVLPSSIARPAPASGYDGYNKTVSSFRPPDRIKDEPRRSLPHADDGGSINRATTKATAPEMDDVTLSVSQKKVLDTIMARKSVFFTGAAGTGKSYILKVLREVLEGLGLSDKVSFTAPTGVAACNIRGMTIHAWAGVGTAAEPMDQLAAMVSRSRVAAQRWKECEILVIDEISMLSAELFDKLSFIGTRVRNDPRPFGGLQLILCGDFFQLPPIGVGKNTHFCFDSKNWELLFGGREDGMILLDKVFRQQNDSVFLNILNDLRMGVVTPQAQKVLGAKVQQSYLKDREAALALNQQTQGQEQEAGSTTETSVGTKKGGKAAPVVAVRPTKLFSTNRDVDTFNGAELEKLAAGDAEGEEETYNAIDEGKEPFLNQLRQGTKAPATLVLRVGAQVMLLKNISTARGLVNGARGTVVGFEKSMNRTGNAPRIPIVRFQIFLGARMTEETVSLDQETWDIKQGDRILASRVQIPLMLAWAISIHKSQGMTIPLLEVSFNNVFEYGQGYVALSRATCLEGLTLRSFQVASIKAHTKVAEFYQRISAATASITAAAAAASVAPTSTPVVDLTSETTTNSSSDTSSGEVPGIITTKVSAFAKAFLKEVPTEDTSNAWIESRNAKTASFKAVVSTYKEKVKKRGEEGDFIDYSQYGTIVQAEGGEGEGAGQEGAGQEGEEERDLRMLQEDEEQEQLMYIIETKNATAAASQRQSKPSAPTSSAKPLLNNQNKAAEGSGGAGAAGNVIGNKFSQFSLPDNEWLDEEPTAAQREKARQAYLKHTAAKTMESTSSALPSSKSPEEMAVVQEDESTTDGFYEIDSEVSNLSCRRTATTAATTSYSTSTTPGMSPAGARSFPLPGNSNSPFPAAVRPSASSMSHSILSGVAQHVNQQPPPPPPATSGPFSNPNHLQNGVCSSVVIDLMDDEEEFSHGASIWGLPAAPVTYKPPQDLAYGSCPVSAVPVRMLSPPPSGSSAPHHQQLYSASFAVGGGAAAATLSWPRAGEFVSGPPGAPFPSSSSRGPPPPSLMKSPAKPPAEASLFQLISGGATGTGSTATGVGGTVLRPFSSANPGNGSTAQMAGNNTSNSSLTGQKIGAVNGCPVVSLSTQPLLAVSAASSGGEAGVHSNSNSLSDEQKRRIEQNKVLAQQRLAEFRARSAAEARKVMEDCKL